MSAQDRAAEGRGRPDLASIVAVFFGTGYFPFAPATFTSLLVTLLLLLIGGTSWGLRVALLVPVTLVGTWAAHQAEKRFGHDARCIVIDEVAGLLLGVLLVPWDLAHLAAGFFLFRVFDVLKPPPVYQLQSLRGGLGIMADDLAAGLLTLLVLLLARTALPFF